MKATTRIEKSNIKREKTEVVTPWKAKNKAKLGGY